MIALVIDDSRAMRTIIGGIMKGLGFKVIEAANGAEGLERLDGADRPDVVMIDWNMPVMNGLEFVKSARSRPKFADVRFIMVTTESEASRMSEALSSGANEYVMKPFTKDVLLGKLEMLGLAPV